jgi:hypothetical protein
MLALSPTMLTWRLKDCDESGTLGGRCPPMLNLFDYRLQRYLLMTSMMPLLVNEKIFEYTSLVYLQLLTTMKCQVKVIQ